MITIIGNGESRKEIDVDKIPGIKIGCNGIYLYNNVDYLCAMDKFWREKISKETKIPLLSRYHNASFQIYVELFEKGKWVNTECIYRGYSSGITALDYACSCLPEDEIYLIGFDFGYKGSLINHMYKDTKFHPKANKAAQNEDIFFKQAIDVRKRYPRKNIYWVTDNKEDFGFSLIKIKEYLSICGISY